MDSLDKVKWLTEQLENERQMRIDLAEIQTKVINRLENKIRKQKKQIFRLVEQSHHSKIEMGKWIGAVGRLNKQVNDMNDIIREDGTLS